MIGGFIAFRCSNYENTAEREQFRVLCNLLKDKYKDSEEFCLLIANYNIFNAEFDAILIKSDAIMAIEFKNYGGKIVATENGDWTSDNKAIKGGSRKTVYQQACVNHVALRNGLRELGINPNWIKHIPSLVVFNQDIELENRLSGKVRTWLHITDNEHFLEKIEDITCKSTDLSNTDIIDIAMKMNLSHFIDQSLSCFSNGSEETDGKTPADIDVADILFSYDRKTPNHVFNLRPNQVFVFGTDTKGSQKYGAAGIAAGRFGAQVGVLDGPTGNCYALPTKGYRFEDFAEAVERFLQYVDNNSHLTFLVTPVGCGHAGFDTKEVASLFKGLLPYTNVMLPELFLNTYNEDLCDNQPKEQMPLVAEKKTNENATTAIERIKRFYEDAGRGNDIYPHYELKDDKGIVIAKAELVVLYDKLVFSPYNSQSVATFRNFGFTICSEDDFIKSHNI